MSKIVNLKSENFTKIMRFFDEIENLLVLIFVNEYFEWMNLFNTGGNPSSISTFMSL